MRHKNEFEKWYLSLSDGSDAGELRKLIPKGVYYYTNVRALYEQYCEIKRLEELVDEKPARPPGSLLPCPFCGNEGEPYEGWGPDRVGCNTHGCVLWCTPFCRVDWNDRRGSE